MGELVGVLVAGGRQIERRVTADRMGVPGLDELDVEIMAVVIVAEPVSK